MPREEKPIEMVQLDYVCDACGEGRMRPNGLMLASDPPQFPHKCNKCGHEQTFDARYPTTGYRVKD